MDRIRKTIKRSIIESIKFYDFFYLYQFRPFADPLKEPDKIKALSDGGSFTQSHDIDIVYSSDLLKFLQTYEPKYLEEAIRKGWTAIIEPRVEFIVVLCQGFIGLSKKWAHQRREIFDNTHNTHWNKVFGQTLLMFYGDHFFHDTLKLTASEQWEIMKKTKERCEKIIKAYFNGISAALKERSRTVDKGGRPVKVIDLINFKNTFETIENDFKERFKNSDCDNSKERYQIIKQYIEKENIIENYPYIGYKYGSDINWQILSFAEEISDHNFIDDCKNGTRKPKKKANDIKRTATSKFYALYSPTPRTMAICLASAIHRIKPLTGKQYLKPLG